MSVLLIAGDPSERSRTETLQNGLTIATRLAPVAFSQVQYSS